jgi:hypothetical protein
MRVLTGILRTATARTPLYPSFAKRHTTRPGVR